MEDIRANKFFILDHCANIDIFNIQEHWLFECEKHLVSKILTGWMDHSRSVDEKCNISPVAKPRGYGGVATLWKPWLDPYVIRLLDGNERIVGTKFNLPSITFYIFNCYLDSAKTTFAISRYKEDITALNELLYKYKDGDIFLLGDMNADVYNRNDAKEKLLKNLIEEHSLVDMIPNTGSSPTYQHKYLGHSSHVDMMFVKFTSQLQRRCTIVESEILPFDDGRNVSNTSTHVPITVTLNIDTKITKPKKLNKDVVKKYSWDKADSDLFTRIVQEELNRINLSLVDHKFALSILQSIIETATAQAVPCSKKVGCSQKTKWYPELKDAVAVAKKSHWEWKDAGEPHRDHPKSIQRRKDRKQVRRVQRQFEASKHSEMLNKISDASEFDSKLFYQLIRRQRASVSSNSAFQLDGGMVIHDVDIIRDTWADHFERLAKDANGYDNDTAHTLDCIRIVMGAEHDENKFSIPAEDVAIIIQSLKSGKACDKQGFCAEQLKLLPDDAVEVIQMFVQECINTGVIPSDLKSGFKIPIPKPKKDSSDMNNDRGITITSIFSEVLELIILKRIEPHLEALSNLYSLVFPRVKHQPWRHYVYLKPSQKQRMQTLICMSPHLMLQRLLMWSIMQS